MEFEGRSRIRAHLDIAPLIDIVFLLLVFFMLTSTFLIPEAIELELPESGSAASAPVSSITVAIDARGEISLNGEPLPLEALRGALEPLIEAAPESPVILKGDARARLQPLLKVMDEIRAAGGEAVALATRPE